MRIPAVALCCLALAGCLTPRVTPEPSAAIKEARARAQAAKAAKADPCGRYVFSTAAPVTIPFPYDQAELTEEGRDQLDRAAAWLACHPAVWVALSAQHDNQGTAADQKRLADQRLAALRQRLSAGGVHPNRLLTYKPARGETLVIEGRGRGW